MTWHLASCGFNDEAKLEAELVNKFVVARVPSYTVRVRVHKRYHKRVNSVRCAYPGHVFFEIDTAHQWAEVMKCKSLYEVIPFAGSDAPAVIQDHEMARIEHLEANNFFLGQATGEIEFTPGQLIEAAIGGIKFTQKIEAVQKDRAVFDFGTLGRVVTNIKKLVHAT